MGKMDEMILVVDRQHLFEEEQLTFQGLLTGKHEVERFMKKFNKYFEVRRGDAEANHKWKQPIPYGILKRGDEVFLYKRLKGGGEARLYDQLSIGVGGHMNRFGSIVNWEDNLVINLHRELHEELILNLPKDYEPECKVVGLINDDNNVGLYHIGIPVIIELPEHIEVTVRETDKLDGSWIRTRDLKKTPLFESLESWSQIVADVL